MNKAKIKIAPGFQDTDFIVNGISIPTFNATINWNVNDTPTLVLDTYITELSEIDFEGDIIINHHPITPEQEKYLLEWLLKRHRARLPKVEL